MPFRLSGRERGNLHFPISLYFPLKINGMVMIDLKAGKTIFLQNNKKKFLGSVHFKNYI